MDINGHRVTDGPDIVHSKSPNSSTTTEIIQNMNGRSVPMERREERVLRDDASGRSVETLIRTYDQAGYPTPPTKEILEERKQPDGSSTIQTATYRSDINGGMELLKKTITDVHKSGSSETSETLLQRPSINGSLETVEKKTTVTTNDSGGGFQREASTYQRDGTGSFVLSVKESTAHTVSGDASTENTARYEVMDG